MHASICIRSQTYGFVNQEQQIPLFAPPHTKFQIAVGLISVVAAMRSSCSSMVADDVIPFIRTAINYGDSINYLLSCINYAVIDFPVLLREI